MIALHIFQKIRSRTVALAAMAIQEIDDREKIGRKYSFLLTAGRPSRSCRRYPVSMRCSYVRIVYSSGTGI
jgi:hypothetical protein